MKDTSLRSQMTSVQAEGMQTNAALAVTDTDVANARRLASRFGPDIRFTAARGWILWDGRRWLPDEKEVGLQAMAKQIADEIFDEVRTAHNRDEMFRHAKRSQSKRAIEAMCWLVRSEPGILTNITDFDAAPWLFNVANGTLDLRTFELRPHRRDDLISKLADVAFDPNASGTRWLSFLRTITNGNAELMDYLQRFVGYLLVGDTSEQTLHFLYGLGANGKSVFCELVMALLGDYALAVSPDLIMLKRYGGIPNDVARLRGVRCAMMNETSQGARFDEAKLKDLTGGDTLTARFLHQEFFDFAPTHRIVIRGNHKPAIDGTDEGIWRRLRLVPFTVTIPEDQRDPHLLKALKAELPGVLAWAVAGCRAWQQHGLRPPAVISKAVAEYRAESDTLGRFISECCEVRKLAQVKSSVFAQRYRAYAEQAGERAVPAKELPHEMQRRGFEWRRTNAGGMFFGLELPAASEWSDGR